MLSHNALRLADGVVQRIGLARALYAEADIYLMDDVLSTLDPSLARRIFHQAILGLRQRSTRIIVTRFPHCFAFADRVVVLERGRIIRQGTPQLSTAEKRAAHSPPPPHPTPSRIPRPNLISTTRSTVRSKATFASCTRRGHTGSSSSCLPRASRTSAPCQRRRRAGSKR